MVPEVFYGRPWCLSLPLSPLLCPLPFPFLSPSLLVPSFPYHFPFSSPAKDFGSTISSLSRSRQSRATKHIFMNIIVNFEPIVMQLLIVFNGINHRLQCIFSHLLYFCRAILCISAAIAVMRCLSVRPSVTFVDHVKTNKHIFKNFLPSGSHTILVFRYQTGWRYSDGHPSRWGIGRNRDSGLIAGYRRLLTCEVTKTVTDDHAV